MPRGGQRRGAGRPVGTTKYKKPTKTMRVPIDMQEEITNFLETNGYRRPLYASHVAAGYPAPCDDYVEEHMSLDEYMRVPPQNTAFAHADGDSMIGAGIYNGDLLILDQKEEPRNGSIVVACIGGEQTVKRFKKTKNRVLLLPENTKYPALDVTDEPELRIVGVVKGTARRF